MHCGKKKSITYRKRSESARNYVIELILKLRAHSQESEHHWSMSWPMTGWNLQGSSSYKVVAVSSPSKNCSRALRQLDKLNSSAEVAAKGSQQKCLSKHSLHSFLENSLELKPGEESILPTFLSRSERSDDQGTNNSTYPTSWNMTAARNSGEPGNDWVPYLFCR